MKRQAGGFTLIELMVTVAIIGILTAIAIPAYTAYVLRARVTEAFTILSGVQPAAEQFWSSNRTFSGMTLPTSTNFTYTMVGTPTATTYVMQAAGGTKLPGLVYTIDQSGNKATTGVPSTAAFAGWTTNATCWVDRKGGVCTQ